MATISTVAAITGSGAVYAISAQGASRLLKVCDALDKGETIRTVGDAHVALQMADGHLMRVTAQQTVRLDDNVVASEHTPTVQDSAVLNPDATVQTVIEALNRGQNLDSQVDATVAGVTGVGGQDSGSTFVQLLCITEGVTSQSYAYSFTASDAPRVDSASLLLPVDSNSTVDVPTATISVDPVTPDNIINKLEANGRVIVTGTVGGSAHAGDTVTLMVGNAVIGTGIVDANGHYGIEVLGSAVAGQTLTALVNGSDAAGNAYAATTEHAVGVDLVAVAEITIGIIAVDDVINAGEAAQACLTISGTVGGDVKAGDVVTLSVNGHSYTTNVVDLGGGALGYSKDVATSDLLADYNITASVTATDAAGNSATATDTHSVSVQEYLVAGGGGDGTLAGGGGNDILVGDVRGSVLTGDTSANIVLVLDVSGSMKDPIAFGNGTETRLQALKDSVNAMLDSLYNSGADNVRVHLDKFSTTGASLGTFDLTVNGVDNATALAAAHAAVNALTVDMYTNYEAGLQSALDLRDLLVGEHDGTGALVSNLISYLHFDGVGGKAVLEIDHAGGGKPATQFDQSITFSNLSLAQFQSSLGLAAGATDADILHKLVSNGNLKTDA